MIDLIKSAAKKMLIDFEDTRRIQHNPTKGRAREFIIAEQFLRPYLPKRYSIGSGLLIDAENNSSRQQDLMIYDEFYSPVLLNLDSEKILFPESVLAVIEVKSTLRSSEVEDIVKKSASVWNLSKTSPKELVLSPGVAMAVIHAPTLCLGMCFSSTLSLDDIAAKMREARERVPNGHALSMTCVLEDKSSNAGLILNVNRDDLHQIVIIPDAQSRLAVVKFDEPGDALLHTYLFLMEHLRFSGTMVPGPNLFQYSEIAGLNLPDRKISVNEMKDAAVNVDGKYYYTGNLTRMSELTPKVLQGAANDSEILEWFLLVPKTPMGDTILDPNAVFHEFGRPLSLGRPLDVYDAIVRKRNGLAVEADSALLDKFIKLIKSIKPESRSIGMSPLN